MSRYIDADKLRRHISKLHCKMCSNRKVDKDGLCISDEDCETHSFDWLEIDDIVYSFPVEDVVSRDQFNACYEECLRLRTENEHLMDCLREKEDDRK